MDVIRTMQIIVLASALQKEELMQNPLPDADVVWVRSAGDFLAYPNGAAFIDLLFVNTVERKTVLQQLLPKTVIVNSVVDVLRDINASFIRVNGWNTFLSASIIEASCTVESVKPVVEMVFASFNKHIEWLHDEP